MLDGIEEAHKAGLNPIKINAVVQKKVNCFKILDLANYFKERGYIVRFIEFMDVGNQNNWDMQHVVSSKHLLEKIQAQHQVEALEPAYFGEVASRYRYLDNGVEFGFISSVTQPFCGSCTRARLSTDGKIYTCLFASQGTDLKTFALQKRVLKNFAKGLSPLGLIGRTSIQNSENKQTNPKSIKSKCFILVVR